MGVLLNQVVSGAFCAFVAGEKNRSPTNWFWLGFCFGPFPIAMLALAALPALAARPTERDTEMAALFWWGCTAAFFMAGVLMIVIIASCSGE